MRFPDLSEGLRFRLRSRTRDGLRELRKRLLSATSPLHPLVERRGAYALALCGHFGEVAGLDALHDGGL